MNTEWPLKGIGWYYHDEWTAIACGDCRDILPKLPQADVVITDPPYGLSVQGGSITGRKNGHTGINQDFFECDYNRETCLSMVLDACRLTVPILRGSAYWFCSHKQFGPLEALLAQRDVPTGFLVWRKLYAPPQVRKASWRYVSELCVWSGRPKNFLNQEKMRNVLEYLPMINGTAKSGHPTEKPVELIEHIVQASSDAGEMILDPFMGSGTTLVAAKNLGRRAIGIEIEEKYCKIAVDRLRQRVFDFNGQLRK